MRRRVVIITGLALITAIAIGGVIAGRVFRTRPIVDGAQVRLGDLEVTLAATGTFETRGVDLAFEIPGRLADVRVSDGARVTRGTLLASLEASEVRATADQADAAAAAARSDAARARAAVESARLQAAVAEAAFRAARATLSGVRAGPTEPELRQADAAVEAARLVMEEARRHLALQEQLYRQGAVAGVQVDAARAQFETTQAQYEQAVARREALRAGASEQTVTATAEQVRQAEAAWRAAQANIRQAELIAVSAAANGAQAAAAARSAHARAARAELRAPFDGTVSRVYLNPGAPVAPNLPVLSLITESGWVAADVDEADIGRVRLGQRARATADAYPSTVVTGRVSRIGGQVDVRLGTRSVRVRVDLDGEAAMRAGTSVDVDLILETVTGGLLVPLDALQRDNGAGAYVFVIEDGILRRRSVDLHERNDQFAVARNGVQEGELVAIGDPAVLQEGRRVSVRVVP
ncbi:MAG TPA: efflux RND transporter periplasmic adaptor subunit [bacterium]